jgi:hypothetical protein
MLLLAANRMAGRGGPHQYKTRMKLQILELPDRGTLRSRDCAAGMRGEKE